MARTGQNENEQANATDSAEKQQAFSTGQDAVGQYEKNLSTLEKGGAIGVDPWLSPTYIANQNKLTANSLDAANNAGKAEIQDVNRRTGGLNTGGSTAAITGLALQKARLADTLNAQRSAADYNKNIQYQTNLASAPLGVASAESPYYGTATSGQDAALNNLTQFGLASYGPWNDLISGVAGAGGAFLGGYGQGLGKAAGGGGGSSGN